MFSGFTKETADFLWELSFNNERPWFQAHKEEYERCLWLPFKALAEETDALVAARFPKEDLRLHIARIYRDARRLHGQGPYKDHLWFSLIGGSTKYDALGFWFEVGAADYSFGVGSFSSSAAQMAAFRASIDADPARFERIARRFAAMPEYKFYAPEYKRPKGDRGELLNPWYNRNNVGVECRRDHGDELLSPALPERLAGEFARLMPLYDYLNEVFKTVPVKEEKI